MTLISPKWLHLAMWHVALESWQWIYQVAAPCTWYVALGWHAIEFAQTFTIFEFYIWFRFRPHAPQSTCHSAPVSEILSKSDHPRQKKMTSCRFLEMADLRHLGFLGSNNGFFEKPNYITSYRSSIDTIALNCLVFQKIAFLHFGVKIQDNRISAILDFRELIMGSVKSPCTTSYRSSIA